MNTSTVIMRSMPMFRVYIGTYIHVFIPVYVDILLQQKGNALSGLKMIFSSTEF